MSTKTMTKIDQDAATSLDELLRRHHAAALDALSPHVRAQLTQRRQAALRGPVAVRRPGLGYAAAGVAALCALAIGLQVRTPASRAPASASAIATIPAASSVDNTTTILDEDPDFYAWLASSDAMQVAME